MTEQEASGGEFEQQDDDTLVKPSEILTKEAEKEDQSKFFEEEHVVRPSERLKEIPIAEIPGEDRLVRPSEVLKKGKAEETGGSEQHTVTIKKEPFEKVRTTMTKVENKTRNDGETDSEYKKRVRETLEEVVNLLERLME
ncbi:MAG: hypothetical protein D6732_09935 [Methanobacteriota archaeon]|nr:MAG: hypothetical protein D6732_09935 [Euryarchaeota archaeon]